MLCRRIFAAFLAVLVILPCTLTEAQAASASSPVQLSCKSAVLVEISTGETLFAYNPDEQLAPASITKVMTMLLVMKALDSGDLTLEEKVSASPYACSMGGSQIWLEPGETMTVDELLRACAVGSANDAAVALAEHIGGSETIFVQQMNDSAMEMGLENTHFMNACGLDEEGHYTSAADIAAMCRALLKYPLITKYTSTWQDSLRGGETELVNTNKLVRFYQGCNGLKTGTTDKAGTCLAASAARGNLGLVAVVLGSKTSAERFDSTRGLLDYGFAAFSALPTPDISAELSPVRVKFGSSQFVDIKPMPPQVIVLEKSAKNDIEQKILIDENVEAPVKAGQKLGTVQVFVGGAPKCEYPLLAAESIEKMDIFTAFGKLLRKSSGR